MKITGLRSFLDRDAALALVCRANGASHALERWRAPETGHAETQTMRPAALDFLASALANFESKMREMC